MKKIEELKHGWKFCKTDLGTENFPSLESDIWEDVIVPHDWAIYGKFSPENDPQPLEDSVMDYHEGMIQIGRTGGLPFIGTGWYVKKIYTSSEYDSYFLEFDGIMNHAEVYINGAEVAYRPFGYSSFSVDISEYIKFNAYNEITVKVNSMPATSRWYPGAGIYRPVRLISAYKEHIGYCGVWAGVEYIENSIKAILNLKIDVTDGDVVSIVCSPDGTEIGKIEGKNGSLVIEKPILWSIKTPSQYSVITEVKTEKGIRDRQITKFGVRSVRFTPNEGFFLNGENMKIQGVCLHHDFGMLGTAYRKDVMRKRLLELKKIGCNAIRTTHNPPCPETLNICDDIGMMVLDEAFDEWHTCKTKNGYATLFDEWADIDLRDMIKRDRNHPSVILYSVGNEIPDQIYPSGRDTCRHLVNLCHEEDPYREVTCGFNKPTAAVKNGLTEEVDVVGLNYTARFYEKYHKEHPNWKMLATETMSAVSSRGEFYLPAVEEVPPIKHENHQVNGYDLSAAACTYVQGVEFEAQNKYPYIAGQFMWAGCDYLGEGTPYREEWPSRSSYFGIFDLAGLKKDRYYAFKSEWTKEPVVHLIPHWNWEKGQLVDVFCYSNLDDIEFYFNGNEINIEERIGSRIYLGKIPFEEGKIEARGYSICNSERRLCASDEIKTAYSPYKIVLNTDAKEIKANGENIIFVEVNIVDKFDTICPNASSRVTFSVEGAGKYIASDGGDATCLRKFNELYCNAFHGKMVAAIQVSDLPGIITLKASSENLVGAEISIETV